MNSPKISLEEAERWKAWLKQFDIDLYTTVIDGDIFPVDLKFRGQFLSSHKFREAIKKLWLAQGLAADTYESWGDDDLGRLEVMTDRATMQMAFAQVVDRVTDELVAAKSNLGVF